MRFPIIVAFLVASASSAALTPEQQKLNVESFEYAWKTIAAKMWEPMPAGLDWQKLHDELLPRVQQAKSMGEARAAMQEMIVRLGLTHFAIFPGDVYESVSTKAMGEGTPGFDFRVIGSEALVTSINPGVETAVRPGWRILAVEGKPVAPLIAGINSSHAKATTRELLLYRALLTAISGPPGATTKIEFEDAAGRRRPLALPLIEPRGAESKFGFLPTQHVFFESKRFSNTGYVHFNLFLDPANISPKFGDSVQSCMKCDGFIIDLRGNPGGLGAMSMGMSGWFISKPNQRLGVMKMKGNELKFVAFPHAETFSGPVAILTDGLTGSTAEIFAAGLKDLGRARIIGTRSAGAALPSMIEKLPNGDGFQYAVANYISEGGKPLEGIGVIPDQEVALTREALLAGRDPVIEAALAYIQKQKESSK